MSATTGPVLALGGITIANRVVFNDQPMDWRIPIATALAAGMFALLAPWRDRAGVARAGRRHPDPRRPECSEPGRIRARLVGERKQVMGTAEKIAMGIIAIGMATTLVLPGRMTPKVIDSLSNFFRGSLATAMAVTKR